MWHRVIWYLVTEVSGESDASISRNSRFPDTLSTIYIVGLEDVTYFIRLLWATVWSEESECCARTYVLEPSLVVMEERSMNCLVFTVRTYSETKYIEQKQRRSLRSEA
jgi:hypothetical protein